MGVNTTINTAGVVSSDSGNSNPSMSIGVPLAISSPLTQQGDMIVSGAMASNVPSTIAVNAALADPTPFSINVAGKTVLFLSGNSGTTSAFTLTGGQQGQFLMLCNVATNTLKTPTTLFADSRPLSLLTGHFSLVVFNSGSSNWLHMSGAI